MTALVHTGLDGSGLIAFFFFFFSIAVFVKFDTYDAC